MTIAGSDSGGGAGIQADLLTFAALGVFGTTAISALTAQNPAGVSGIHRVPATFVREQAEQICRYFPVYSAKTGMLADAEIISAVADFFAAHREIKLVVDPVIVATSGARLIPADAVSVLRERLLSRATLVTPNLDEAEVLLDKKFSWRENPNSEICARDSASELAEKLGVPVLLKGGHGAGNKIFDTLAFPRSASVSAGKECFSFSHSRIENVDTHGSGCTLSAAIVAEIAKFFAGENFAEDVPARALADCVSRANDYVHAAISRPISVAGTHFIAHLRA